MEEYELIDKRMVLKEIVKICDKECNGNGELCDSCKAYKVYEILDKMPAIKAVPIENGRYIKAGEVSAIVEDGKPVGFYRPEGPEESEAEHRAEVFERMAFKLGEELDAAKKYIKNALVLVPCGACLYRDETSDSEYCKDCTKRNSKFVFSAEKAREEE